MRDGLVVVLVGISLGLGACANPASTEEITYYKDAAPIITRYCGDCHTAGGIAPFALSDYQAARDHAYMMRKAITDETMPPWLASDAGLPLRYSRKLPTEYRERLLAWIDGGALEGDAEGPVHNDIPPAESVAPPRPDLRLDPGVSYLPNSHRADDYRCFIVHDELAKDLYVQAAIIRPDQQSLVHHAIVYEIAASAVAKVRAQVGKDGLPGYDCFGGAGGDDNTRVLMAWAPGSVPARFPPQTGLKISAGSILALQVHYNLSARQPVPDRTTAELELLSAPPTHLAQIWPIADPADLHIKAGDPAAQQTVKLEVWLLQAYFGFPAGNMYIHGAAPHMHLRGHKQTVAVDNGPLLLDIPRWNFHWQLPYVFNTPYEVRPQDTIVLNCEFDNSAENQPLVDGQRQPPTDLRWGEGTGDEMCLNFLYVTPVPN